MKRWAVVSSALFAAMLPVQGNPAIVGHAFTSSMSAAITRLGDAEVRNGRTPGLTIGVVEDGRLVYARGFGFANAARKFPVAPDTEFYVGDITRQFTAAAVLMLSQDGKLKLDDKVVKYLPELTVAADVSIAQLLQQTSGLPDYLKDAQPPLDFSHSEKPADLIAGLNAMKPAAPPGAVYADNPVNYLLAGMIVERASGEPLSDFLQQRIFVPLVMDRTFLAGDTGISPARAVGYTHAGAGFTPTQPWDPAWLAGDRGLVTTIYDLSKWDIEMPVLVRVDAVRAMLTSSGTPGPAHYGMGWVIDQRGGKNFVWYAGQVPGYQATNAVLPDDHIAVIVLANTDALHGGRVVSPVQVAVRVLDVVSPPATTQLDNAVVSRAKEWLQRLAEKNVDRTQLTPTFSAYLTDDLVTTSDFAALGKLQTIVPISSTAESNGDTLYEFIVQYPHARYHYRFALTKDGKIDELSLVD
jgi:D-alanyl-D-alanine carboxypeptidase